MSKGKVVLDKNLLLGAIDRCEDMIASFRYYQKDEPQYVFAIETLRACAESVLNQQEMMNE
jgi:hypothetical protein